MDEPKPRGGLPPLSSGDYERFGQLVERHAGLAFPEKRRAELAHRLLHAFAASTCSDLDEYYRLLRQPDSGALEMDRLVNALTVGETYFFRDMGQFDALRDHVLPEIIARRRPIRTLRLWSAGCASGEEPYSLAILLRELLPDVDEWAITILATDINTEALDRARKAVYGDWAFREAQARYWRPRYFHAHGKRYELAPDVRRLVTFEQLNLAGDRYPRFETNTTMMDLILCRNVTIYFGESVTRAVIDRLFGALCDGGWLVVGHSEASPVAYRQFQARVFPGAVLYNRLGPGESVPPQQAPPPIPTEPHLPPARFDPGVPPLPLAPAPPQGADTAERARDLLDYGRSEDARDLLLEAVDGCVTPPAALLDALLGQAYANLGDWPRAEHWCRQAIQADRLSLDAYYTLALVLQHQCRLDEAIGAMKKVVYVDRNYVLGYFGLADLYHDTGQLPQALKALDNARRILQARTPDEIIPGSGGITVGRLYDTVVRQQQQWTPQAHAV